MNVATLNPVVVEFLALNSLLEYLGYAKENRGPTFSEETLCLIVVHDKKAIPFVVGKLSLSKTAVTNLLKRGFQEWNSSSEDEKVQVREMAEAWRKADIIISILQKNNFPVNTTTLDRLLVK